MCRFNKLWGNKTENLVLYLKSPYLKFNAVVIIIGELKIQLRNSVYSDVDHLFWFNEHAKSVCDGDHQLKLWVKTFNVQARIRFCKSQVLRLLQGFRIILFLLKYFGKDIVRRAIKNAFDASKQIIVIIFLQVPDNGYASAHRSFIQNRFTILLLQMVDFLKMFREHFFVRCYYGFPFLQCRFYNVECSIGVIY